MGYSGPTFKPEDARKYAGQKAVDNLAATLRAHVQAYTLLVENKSGLTLDQFSRTKPVDDKVWRDFSKNIFYCEGDLTDAAAYQKLEGMLTSFGQAPLR